MTADPYGTSSEIPAAACTWPDHGDVGCPRCAVLLACRDQVPKHYYQWATQRGYEAESQPSRPTWPTRLEMRSLVAPQVADRLLAWLRWPGEPAADHVWRGYLEKNPDHAGDEWVRTELLKQVSELNGHPMADLVWHPLDGTDVAGLRPCTVGFSEEEIAMDLEWQMSAVHDGLLDGGDVTPLSVATDWPAVAVVADYLSTCGGWRWVHDFREQMTDEEFYRLPPVQDAMRAMGDLWID